MDQIKKLKQRFGIIGNSKLLNTAIQRSLHSAPTPLTVLITGENGTGKESFSQIIHHYSHRKNGKFIAINCGAIPEGTIDSELFGHEKGAFTGAVESRKGYFEEANKGTLFLDEIGEMPLATQARLLRILEYGEYIRVGASKVQKTDVRVVAATNINLLEAVQKKRFREDLYYRLNAAPIYIPPLRDRGDDILLLFKKFATDFSDQNHISTITLSESAKKLLLNYSFPGNIRQLKNIVEQLALFEPYPEITGNTLKNYLPKPISPISDTSSVLNLNVNNVTNLFNELTKLSSELISLKLKVEHMQNQINTGNRIQYKNKEKNNSDFSQQFIALSEEGSLKKNQNNFLMDPLIQEEDTENLSLEKKEKEMILKALHRYDKKRKPTAKSLGISERTLYRKLEKYGIES